MLKFSGQSRSSEVVIKNVLWLYKYDINDQLYIIWKVQIIILEAASCWIKESTKCDGPNVNAIIRNAYNYQVALIWFVFIVDPQANVASGIPKAAICVQVIAAQYILQFAIVIALCCALHRFASRVIHRSEWFFNYFISNTIHLNCELFVYKTGIMSGRQRQCSRSPYGPHA